MELLIEPFGGLAGDMFLAALLDLEDPRFTVADLRAFVADLLPETVTLEPKEVRRSSLRALQLDVVSPESEHPPHRHLSDLVALLDAAGLAPPLRERTVAVLQRIAEAEAKVHGIPVERVHFHEVGAVDTLVDVAGAVFALDRLGVTRVLSTRPYVGGGTVRCAHGEMPVPAPGTAALLSGLAFDRGPGGERLTPTGAALLAVLVDEHEPTSLGSGRRLGYGSGSREPAEGPPNLVRVSLLEPRTAPSPTRVEEVSCNLDDITGEELGFLMEELREAGALDVWCTPVQMKKGRPGQVLSLLARSADRQGLERLIFAHSPTLGLRWHGVTRTECGRESVSVDLAGTEVRVKVRRPPGLEPMPEDLSPELEDLARLARDTGRTLRDLEAEARRLAWERLDGGRPGGGGDRG